MGTKRNPGKFDCYFKAELDEPMFVLLGRDPLAPILVKIWVEMKRKSGEKEEKLQEAQVLIDELKAWAIKIGKEEEFKRFCQVYNRNLIQVTT